MSQRLNKIKKHLLLFIPEEWKFYANKNGYRRTCFQPNSVILFLNSCTVWVLYNLLKQKGFFFSSIDIIYRSKNVVDNENIEKTITYRGWKLYITLDIQYGF